MGSGASANELSYDLFLSYNSADHRIVEEVAHKLANAGLKELFLDRWNLPIGTRWMSRSGVSPFSRRCFCTRVFLTWPRVPDVQVARYTDRLLAPED
jgi:hypothetical protein